MYMHNYISISTYRYLPIHIDIDIYLYDYSLGSSRWACACGTITECILRCSHMANSFDFPWVTCYLKEEEISEVLSFT